MRDRTLSSVDFPAPLRPTKPTTSPGSSLKLTSRSAQCVSSASQSSLNRRSRLAGSRTNPASDSRNEVCRVSACPIR